MKAVIKTTKESPNPLVVDTVDKILSIRNMKIIINYEFYKTNIFTKNKMS